jgi:hypothetical protein
MPLPEFPDTSTVEGQLRARAILAGVAMRIAVDASAEGNAKLERKAIRTASRAARVHPVLLKAAMDSGLAGGPGIVGPPGSN